MIRKLKKYLTILLCSIMAMMFSMTSVSFADDTSQPSDTQTTAQPTEESFSVEIDASRLNNSEGQIISGLFIDKVDKPEPGKPLDDTAEVTTAEDITWEIPVLWIDDQVQFVTQAYDGRLYFPVLAFFIPSEYNLADTDFEVKLSKELVKLFIIDDIISVYNAETGIMYILPAKFRNLFTSSSGSQSEENHSRNNEQHPEEWKPAEESVSHVTPEISDIPGSSDRCLIDIYCAQTAKDALTDDDLEYLIDLIINKLEPQAVNLLLEKFPAFRMAADMGQVGREIGLYIFYGKGDIDGRPGHENTPKNVLAYVEQHPDIEENGMPAYTRLLGINAKSMVLRDNYGNPKQDPKTGRFILVRDGNVLDELENALVREFLHTFMGDLNRTGMVGFKDKDHIIYDYENMTDSEKEMLKVIQYPQWFIEGTASAVDNTFQSQYDLFRNLLVSAEFPSNDGPTVETNNEFTKEAVLANYLLNEYELRYSSGGFSHADGTAIDPFASRNVSGYLAVVYLSELAARKDGRSSLTTDETNNEISFSSEIIRLGLNSILEKLHQDRTLDEVIVEISPTDTNGTPIYSSTDDFTSKFICGSKADGQYPLEGDPNSLEFTTLFLNYMNDINYASNREYGTNGSILFDFDKDFSTPLDRNKEDNCDSYEIFESNECVASTVSYEEALSSGGKSEYDAAQAGRTTEVNAPASTGESEEVNAPASAGESAGVNVAASENASEVIQQDMDPAVGDIPADDQNVPAVEGQ